MSTACLQGFAGPPWASSSPDRALSHHSGPLDFVLKPHYIACPLEFSNCESCLPLNIFIPHSWSACLAKLGSKCCPQPPLGEGGRPGGCGDIPQTLLLRPRVQILQATVKCSWEKRVPRPRPFPRRAGPEPWVGPSRPWGHCVSPSMTAHAAVHLALSAQIWKMEPRLVIDRKLFHEAEGQQNH